MWCCVGVVVVGGVVVDGGVVGAALVLVWCGGCDVVGWVMVLLMVWLMMLLL